jgi:hypothetical protein
MHFCVFCRLKSASLFAIMSMKGAPLSTAECTKAKGGEIMTDMKRITVALPDNMMKSIDALKQSDDFKGRPYSEIIRALVQRGLDKAKKGGVKK